MERNFIFIGNRYNVLKECLQEPTWKAVSIYALRGSYLEKQLVGSDIIFKSFELSDRHEVIENIRKSECDVLVSNGCPFLLPVRQLQNTNCLCLNTHPSLLPELKGPHAINGVFFHQHSFFGATTHIMSEEVDSGNILAQRSEPVTADLDLGLLYYLSFELEGAVFNDALQSLKRSAYDFSGIPQTGPSSFYRRKQEDMIGNPLSENTATLLKKVKSFGIKSLGVKMSLVQGEFLIFDAHKITNERLLSNFANRPAGEIVLEYDGKLLVKSLDGLLRVDSFKKL